VVKSDTKMADPGEEVSAGAGCPLGKTAIAGGLNSGQPLAILGSSPGGQWWYVNAKNVGSAATAMYAYAVCAVVS
jgi:hypothetical protein